VQSFRGAGHLFRLDQGLWNDLDRFARSVGATPFMVLLAAYQALLARLSGQTDICVGCPVSGRTRAEVEGVIGFFANTLVLRTDLSGAPSFAQLVGRVRETVLGAFAHQEVPFEKLVEELQPERALSHQPLFQVAFVLQNAPAGSERLPGGLRLTPVAVDAGTAKFHLTLSLMDGSVGPVGLLEYNTDLFEAASIRRFACALETLLTAAVGAPETPLLHLPVIPAAGVEQLRIWGDGGAGAHDPRPFHRLFEARAAETPEAVALIHGADSLPYGDLNRRANRLARHLAALGAGAEVPVGICLCRSFDLIVAVLAVLKAGGAWLPLDPQLPAERLALAVQQTGVPLIIAEGATADALPLFWGQVVDLNEDWDEGYDDTDLEMTPPADGLAYIIFTSGSTGEPKGVEITQGGLSNLVHAQIAAFGLTPASRVLQFAAFSFDASVSEICTTLAVGATLHLGRGDRPLGRELVELLAAERITCATLPPSLVAVLPEAELPALATLVVAGEACPPGLRTHWGTGRRFLNAYGPTEATVCATIAVLDEESPVTIGRPIAGVRVHLLDTAGRPVPIGVAGELCIGGAGIARGYRNRPDLTAERFVPDPFGPPGSRLYRSGDRARWRSDGTIEFLGRLDTQVKIRGFRIEPGEVEAVLEQHQGVSRAVVVAQGEANAPARLVAYMVPSTPALDAADTHLYGLPNGLRVAQLNRNETDFLYQEIFEEKIYLHSGIALADGDIVFDVGANIGLFSLFAHLTADVEVFAFEPIPPIRAVLAENVRLHGVRARVFACGLSAEPGLAEFTYYPQMSGMSGLYADLGTDVETARTFAINRQAELADVAGVLLAERFASERHTCALRTISEIIAAEGVERIDLLKIDVEKAELDVLQGIAPGDWSKIRQVVLELHDIDGRLAAVTALLTGAGFTVTAEQDIAFQGTSLYNLYAVRPGPVRASGRGRRTSGPTSASRTQLRAFLAAHLPEYMIPARFVALSALPLTVSGKVDRAALRPPADRNEEAGEVVAPRDALEMQLVQIWEELLDRRPVGLTDNFFDLGGHSLLAVRLMARLGEVFAVHLPLASLFSGPTVAQLAGVLRSHSANLPFSVLVPIQVGGAALPLFCVHPAGGNVLCYAPLARALGSERPVWGLQARGVDGREAPLDSIEAMAEEYLAALRSVQPVGPYHLVGHSLGGQVVYEMARRLTAAGETVALATILDTPAPHTVEGSVIPDDDAGWLVALASVIGRFWGVEVPLALEDLQGRSPTEQVHVFHEKLLAVGVVPPGSDPLLVAGLVAVYRANTRAALLYRPAPFAGR
jgi:amino acid adenylation domain-containing protein/FkbM family methyltransferase